MSGSLKFACVHMYLVVNRIWHEINVNGQAKSKFPTLSKEIIFGFREQPMKK